MTIDVINLAGDPHARGRAHGITYRSQIRAHIADLFQSIEQAGFNDPRNHLEKMLRQSDFVTATKRHTSDLLEEVRGIALGAEEPPELLFALQVMDEEWAYRRRCMAQAAALQKCSSLAIVSQDGPTWIGQNMDLAPYTDGHQVLLSIAANGTQPAALVFSTMGMIGLMGVNSLGVGVCVNSLPQLPSASEGLPVAFVLRRLLQASSLAEAAELVYKLPHATSQHYLIAEAGAARSFEVSATGVVEYHATDPARVAHTNHPLAAQGTPQSAAERANTVARLQSLTRRMSAGDPGLEEIKAALSSFDNPDYPVCMLRDERRTRFTNGSMISALFDPPHGVDAWVSAGPPSIGGYTAFHLPQVS